MEDFAPSKFLGSWALVIPYLCFKFLIFDRFILEKYIFQVKGAYTCFNHAYMQHEMAYLL